MLTGDFIASIEKVKRTCVYVCICVRVLCRAGLFPLVPKLPTTVFVIHNAYWIFF